MKFAGRMVRNIFSRESGASQLEVIHKGALQDRARTLAGLEQAYFAFVESDRSGLG